MLCGARSGRGGARLVRDSTAPPPNMRSPTPMGCLRPHVSAPAVPTGEPRPCQRRTGGSAPVSAAQRVRRPPVHRNACASRSQRCDSIPPNSAMGYPFRNSEICRRFSFFALRAFFYMRKNSKHLQISEFLNKPEPCRPQDRPPHARLDPSGATRSHRIPQWDTRSEIQKSAGVLASLLLELFST